MDLLHSEGVRFFCLMSLSVICKVSCIASSMAGVGNLWGKGVFHPVLLISVTSRTYL